MAGRAYPVFWHNGSREAMKKLLIVLLPVLFIVPGWLLYRQRSAPAEAAFVRVSRETLVSALVTNGKVEPLEWSAALAERTGVVETFRAERGRRVNRGDVLVELETAEARTEFAAAQERVAEARAGLQLLERGGRAAELAGLEGEAEDDEFVAHLESCFDGELIRTLLGELRKQIQQPTCRPAAVVIDAAAKSAE